MHPETPFRVAFVLLAAAMVLVRLRAHRQARVLEPGVQNPDEGPAVRTLRWLMVPLWGLITLAWLVTPDSVSALSLPYPSWLRWSGVGVTAAGLALLVWVHHTLGRFFSPYLRIRADHELITEGPYRRVRHPMYTSFLLLLGGFALISANLFFTLALVAMFIIVIVHRTRREEAMLQARFGPAWEAYRDSTGALWPKRSAPSCH